MHILIGVGYFTAILAVIFLADRWERRPAAQRRWARLSLRDKIRRAIRRRSLGIAIGIGYLAGLAAWHYCGHLPTAVWLVSSAWIGLNLATNAWFLVHALGVRREYDRLAYIAEVRHAFGDACKVMGTEWTAHNE
jgi:hypothetical protein